MSGRVVLVGAGPGDPDLLTVRALRELGRAETLLYDALIAPALLELVRPGCERIDVGKRGDGTRGVPQDEIAMLMIQRARAGRYVVRLKGGDPFLFGRGGEEATSLAAAGIPFEIVPGVSSALAVPAYAGIPVTDRRAASSLAVLTGHRAGNREANRTDWEGLARAADTLVIMMGTTWLEDIAARVIAGGRDPATPAAVIANGATAAQRVVRAPLGELAERVREAGLDAPTIVVIGEVVRFHDELSWYEKRPLFGKRVLVLRAEPQRGRLVELLASAGAEPVLVPLLRFEACGDPRGLGAERWDWTVFSSANAVRFAAPHLPVPGHGAIACIGAATARAARSAGLEVDLVPEGPSLPRELAQAMARHADLKGARVLLPQARDARPELAEALAHLGARVESVVVYRNFAPPEAEDRLRAALDEGIDAALLTSPSTVQRLACVVAGRSGFSEFAGRAALVCIGPTTAEALCRAGGEPAVVARTQSDEGLVEALERHYTEGSHVVSA